MPPTPPNTIFILANDLAEESNLRQRRQEKVEQLLAVLEQTREDA